MHKDHFPMRHTDKCKRSRESNGCKFRKQVKLLFWKSSRKKLEYENKYCLVFNRWQNLYIGFQGTDKSICVCLKTQRMLCTREERQMDVFTSCHRAAVSCWLTLWWCLQSKHSYSLQRVTSGSCFVTGDDKAGGGWLVECLLLSSLSPLACSGLTKLVKVLEQAL